MFALFARAAFRRYRKRPLETLLICLTAILGLTGVSIGTWYAVTETNADPYDAPTEHIYRVWDEVQFGDSRYSDAYTLGSIAPYAVENVAGVEKAGRYRQCPVYYLRIGSETFPGGTTVCFEGSLYEILNLHDLTGSGSRALERPDAVVLTRSLAVRLFGDTDVIGETILVPLRDGETPFVVGAVTEDLPPNSHIEFDLAISWMSQSEREQEQNTFQYVQIDPDVNPEIVSASLEQFVTETLADKYVQKVGLEPFENIYLSDMGGQTNGRPLYIRTILLLGIGLLGLAFLNLFALRAVRARRDSSRSGIQRALGASWRHTAFMSTVETLLLAIPIIPGVLLTVVWLLPKFNRLAFGTLSPDPATLSLIAVASLALLGGLSFLVGIGVNRHGRRRPAADLIRGTSSGPTGGAIGSIAVRRLLLGLQCAVCTALLVGVGVMNRQFEFLTTFERGHRTDDLVFVDIRQRSHWEQAGQMSEALAQIAGVREAMASTGLPGSGRFGFARLSIEVATGDERVTVTGNVVDEKFPDLMGLRLVTGRWFRPPVPDADVFEIVVNESAVERLGFDHPEQAVGYASGRYLVVGVMEDFHHGSLHESIQPFAIWGSSTPSSSGLALNVRPEAMPDLLDEIRSELADFGPPGIFEVTTYEDQMQSTYQSEKNLQTALLLIGRIALLIVIAGFWSVASHIASMREREFGIRRVIGADKRHVLGLHLRDFILLLPPAIIAGAVTGFQLIEQWIARFAYQPESTWPALIPVSLIISVSMLGTAILAGYGSVMKRPVSVLRRET